MKTTGQLLPSRFRRPNLSLAAWLLGLAPAAGCGTVPISESDSTPPAVSWRVLIQNADGRTVTTYDEVENHVEAAAGDVISVVATGSDAEGGIEELYVDWYWYTMCRARGAVETRDGRADEAVLRASPPSGRGYPFLSAPIFNVQRLLNCSADEAFVQGDVEFEARARNHARLYSPMSRLSVFVRGDVR